MMKETGCGGIKIEGGEEIIESVKKIISAGIPVMGHLGLTPQSINKFGTYEVRAKEDEIMNYYAIGQCTPGIIAVNTATFIGNKVAGIPGGIFATFGVVFPSIVIITLIAAFLTHIADILNAQD